MTGLNPFRYLTASGPFLPPSSTPPPGPAKFKIGDKVVVIAGDWAGLLCEITLVNFSNYANLWQYDLVTDTKVGTLVVSEDQLALPLPFPTATSAIYNWGTSIPSKPKYKMGDKAKHVPTQSPGIVGNAGDLVANDWVYWFQFSHGGGTYVNEADLAIEDKPALTNNWSGYKCECGSSKTYGEDTNLHASYCPRFRS